MIPQKNRLEKCRLDVKSIYDLIDELLSLNHFSVEKMHDFDVFNECVTDRPTDQQTAQRTQPIIEMRGRI